MAEEGHPHVGEEIRIGFMHRWDRILRIKKFKRTIQGQNDQLEFWHSQVRRF